VIIALAALILAAVPHAPTKAALAGFYESRTMEVGGGLELRKDGHFSAASRSSFAVAISRCSAMIPRFALCAFGPKSW
jgi:hypothetical protein